MKFSKIAFAASIALISLSSMAEVTISGVADVAVIKHDIRSPLISDKETKLISQGSNLSFSAKDEVSQETDVGAFLQLPVDFSDGSTNSSTFSKSFVYLVNENIGLVWAGKNRNQFNLLSHDYDYFGHDSMFSNHNLMGQTKFSIKQNSKELSNTLGFSSKQWQNMQIHASYSKDADYLNDNKNVSLSYGSKEDTINAFVSYQNQQYINLNNEKGLRLGVKYNVTKDTEVAGLLENIKIDMSGVDYKRNAFSLMGKHNMGQHNVHATYTKISDGSLSGVKSNDAAWQMAFGYSYAITQKTQVYAQMAKLNNSNFGYNLTGNDVNANNSKHNVYGIGIKHVFN